MDSTVALNLCIFTALVCWGAWGIFDKLALKRAPAIVVLVCILICALPAAALSFIWLCYQSPGWSVTLEVALWTGLGFLSYGLAAICYLQAMEMSEASFVLGSTAAYPIVLQFLSAFFLGEAIVPVRVAGSILVAIGIAAIGFSKPAHERTERSSREHAEVASSEQAENPCSDQTENCCSDQTEGSSHERTESSSQERIETSSPEKSDDARRSPRLILLVIGATILWGVWGLFDKKAVMIAGPVLSFFAHSLWEMLVLVPLVIWTFPRYKSFFFVGKTLWIPVGISALCACIGGLAYLLALSMATASYVIVITGCYPMVMYLLALCILKEQFNLVRLIGIILLTAGGIITQTTQSS